jgi:hypothetical protein
MVPCISFLSAHLQERPDMVGNASPGASLHIVVPGPFHPERGIGVREGLVESSSVVAGHHRVFCAVHNEGGGLDQRCLAIETG